MSFSSGNNMTAPIHNGRIEFGHGENRLVAVAADRRHIAGNLFSAHSRAEIKPPQNDQAMEKRAAIADLLAVFVQNGVVPREFGELRRSDGHGSTVVDTHHQLSREWHG